MKRITKIEENMLLEKRKLRVAAYCRVSTARDEQLVSLAAQKAHYENYIKSNDEWEFAGLYYDEGISGTKKEKRDGLLAMVAACERGTIDFVITKSISRFARNTTDCLELVRKLLDLKIYIYFEKENLNTGSMESELMLSILSSLAESESVSISENEKWGIKRRFQNGTFIISYPPYGYDNVDGEMVIVPEQAEIVKQIFADTLAGKSTHEIADELNERGVATKKGGHWTPGTVNAIIGNEKYTGDVLFQKTYTDNRFNRHQNRGELDQYLMKDHHEAIISKEEFELANAVLKQRGREKGNGHDTGRYQNRYGFSGRICCGECGGKYKRRMHYKPSGQYVAWACANHLKDKESCSQKYITDDALKLAFVTMMNKLVFGHQMVLRPLLQSLRGLNDQSRLLKIEELETAIEKNREQKQVLTNLMASGYLEPALFNKESNELAAEAEALRQEKDGLMRSVNGDMVKIEELQRLLRFTSKGTMMTEFDDEIFLSFAERITVLSRKEVVFEWKCGLSSERKAGGTMRHIPYGYRIENGRAVIDEEQAATVRDFFQKYISGMALMPAAEKVGLNLYHGSAGRMLRNKKYLGDDYYPAIIDKETFDKAEKMRMNRAKALGRVWELEGKKDILFPTNFTIPALKKVSDDPFEQAAYAYSLIESEVDGDGTE